MPAKYTMPVANMYFRFSNYKNHNAQAVTIGVPAAFVRLIADTCLCFSAVLAAGVPVVGVLGQLWVSTFAFLLEKIVQLMSGLGEC